jgi:hypothetical protein
MKELGIPVEIINSYWSANGPKGSSGTQSIGGNISMYDLYDILIDEEKLKVLISKIRNKAFW